MHKNPPGNGFFNRGNNNQPGRWGRGNRGFRRGFRGRRRFGGRRGGFGEFRSYDPRQNRQRQQENLQDLEEIIKPIPDRTIAIRSLSSKLQGEHVDAVLDILRYDEDGSRAVQEFFRNGQFELGDLIFMDRKNLIDCGMPENVATKLTAYLKVPSSRETFQMSGHMSLQLEKWQQYLNLVEAALKDPHMPKQMESKPEELGKAITDLQEMEDIAGMLAKKYEDMVEMRRKPVLEVSLIRNQAPLGYLGKLKAFLFAFLANGFKWVCYFIGK